MPAACGNTGVIARGRSRPLSTWCVGVVLVLAACEKVNLPLPRVPRPADVVAVVKLPSIEAKVVDEVVEFAEHVAPDDAPELRAELDELEKTFGPDTIDRSRPLHIVVVSPPPGADEPDVLVLVVPRDVGKLERALSSELRVRVSHGWAAIGSPAVVERVSPWALGTLAVEPMPLMASATLYSPAIVTRWSDEIRAEFAGSTSPAMNSIRDAVLGLLSQSERVEVQVELASNIASIEVRLVPRRGTTLAAVLAAQRASAFAMLDRLPLQRSMATTAGTLSLGPLGPDVRELLTALIASELGKLSDSTRAVFDTLWAAGTGEFAGVTIDTGATVNAFGVADAVNALAPVGRVSEAIGDYASANGVSFVVESDAAHAGVPIHIAKLATPDQPGGFAVAAWAAWDDIIAMTMPGQDVDALRETLDRFRGAPASAVPPGLATVLAKARHRGDSMIQTLDVVPGEQSIMVIGIGVRDGTGHLWASFPREQVATVVRLSADDDE